MRTLLDTDAFCKLAVGDLLSDTIELLGSPSGECRRLPALPYMLKKKGKLRKQYGEDLSDRLSAIADAIPPLECNNSAWYDRLTAVHDVDVGEAQLFSSAAEHQSLIVSGDKRAVRALKTVPDICFALRGRIVTLEPLLISLCEKVGKSRIIDCARKVAPYDTVFRVCFSADDPCTGLRSYFNSFKAEVAPLVLWTCET